MADGIEISVKGKWGRVPALEISGTVIAVTGRWIKLATVHDEHWLERELADPEACVARLKQGRSHGLRADVFTFGQKLPATVPKYSYHLEWDSIAAARTSNFMKWWDALPQESRKNARRAQKRGVVVTVRKLDDDLIHGVVRLNNASPIRQGRRYTHYGKTFEQVKRDHASFLDRSDFVCAYLGDELIGYLKLVYRGEIASILNIISDPGHFDKRPSNALITSVIELCEAKHVEYLTYGMFNYGNKGNTPVREFKTRNGFEEILVPRYYIPLTTWGTICLKTNLHHGLLGSLPRWVIKAGTRGRAAWYDMRQWPGRCSSIVERSNSNRQTERSIPPAGSNVTDPLRSSKSD